MTTLYAAYAGLMAIAAALFTAWRMGAGSAKSDQMKKDVKARDIAKDVENDVASRSADENRERLKKWEER